MIHQTDRILVVVFFVSIFYSSIITPIAYAQNNEPNETSNSYFGNSQISSLKEQFAKYKTQFQNHTLEVVENGSELLNYRNPEIGISFQYPKEWKKPVFDINPEKCRERNDCFIGFALNLFLEVKRKDPAIFDPNDFMKLYLVAVQATMLDKPRESSSPCNCRAPLRIS